VSLLLLLLVFSASPPNIEQGLFLNTNNSNNNDTFHFNNYNNNNIPMQSPMSNEDVFSFSFPTPSPTPANDIGLNGISSNFSHNFANLNTNLQPLLSLDPKTSIHKPNQVSTNNVNNQLLSQILMQNIQQGSNNGLSALTSLSTLPNDLGCIMSPLPPLSTCATPTANNPPLINFSNNSHLPNMIPTPCSVNNINTNDQRIDINMTTPRHKITNLNNVNNINNNESINNGSSNNHSLNRNNNFLSDNLTNKKK